MNLQNKTYLGNNNHLAAVARHITDLLAIPTSIQHHINLHSD